MAAGGVRIVASQRLEEMGANPQPQQALNLPEAFSAIRCGTKIIAQLPLPLSPPSSARANRE